MDKKLKVLYFEFEIALSALLMVAGDFLPGGDRRFDAAVAKVKAIKLQIWRIENGA